jgi:hypothetical protein
MTMMSDATIAQPGHPPEVRPHRAGDPERTTCRSRVGAVHVPVAERDAEHRDERHEQHRRRLQPTPGTATMNPSVAGKAVCGRGRGDADDDVRRVADGAVLQALVAGAPDSARRGLARARRRSIRLPPRPSSCPCRGALVPPSACEACTAAASTARWQDLSRPGRASRVPLVRVNPPLDTGFPAPTPRTTSSASPAGRSCRAGAGGSAASRRRRRDPALRRGRRGARATSRSATSAWRPCRSTRSSGTVDREDGLRPPVPPDDRARARALGADRQRGAPRRADAPISLFRIGEVHFVRDGHHRVSVAARAGPHEIDAYVVEVVHARRRRPRAALATCPRRATSASSTSACRCPPRAPGCAPRRRGTSACSPRPSRPGPSG